MDLIPLFPRLQNTPYRVTSPPTWRYNCIAWAAGDESRWWWPMDPFYWPAGVPSEETISAFETAYQTIGYEVCADGTLEAGIEKVAIYADRSGAPKHAARQLDDGRWTSKLGRSVDISHTLEGLESAAYGRAVRFMARPRRPNGGE